jgi:hypothetical protein
VSSCFHAREGEREKSGKAAWNPTARGSFSLGLTKSEVAERPGSGLGRDLYQEKGESQTRAGRESWGRLGTAGGPSVACILHLGALPASQEPRGARTGKIRELVSLFGGGRVVWGLHPLADPDRCCPKVLREPLADPVPHLRSFEAHPRTR